MTATTPVVQCSTCGVERSAETTGADSTVCPICADDRQYLPPDGQHWLDPREPEPAAHLSIAELEPGVHAITQHDCPGIGQTPLLVETAAGPVMIEVPTHIDDRAIAEVARLGGLAGIIASHPHMYGLQSLWSEAFGHCPVYISAKDEQWLGHRPTNTVIWDGELRLAEDMVASQPGGHFPGSVVVHWRGRDGGGVLFGGDTIFPTPAAGWVTFMRSFPNMIPLSADVVTRIAKHVARYDFDRLYNNFGRCLPQDAHDAVQRSARRYADWVSGIHDHLT
ncbi:hydrolase [Enemella sp. A6]|uniref:hydrolase n=1 Tax=Enemella sp. A6 TaxID=3440152 RepID=UPI003EC0BD09